MAKLTLFVDNQELEYSTLQFCDELNKNKNELKCGKFDPPVMVKNELIEIIHFVDFNFSKNGEFFFVMPRPLKFKVRDVKNIKFSIIVPGKISMHFINF